MRISVSGEYMVTLLSHYERSISPMASATTREPDGEPLPFHIW